MDSVASFAMATGEHYITMLQLRLLIASHDHFALQFLWPYGERCYGII